ncbi:MAG: hypothetical protein OEV94_07520 [Deltaproteobacteria bacterium]|nr:hypothetical protein [Deltaproteobacteria bacterium]
MFQVGEKVVYPQYGLGNILDVVQRQVSGIDMGFYRLEFPAKQMEIFVPVARARENGLRKVMSQQDVNRLIDFIESSPSTVKPQQWHRWRKKTLEQLRSGEALDMAQIFCYLNNLEKKKGLSFTERKILLQVEEMLMMEISAAKQITEQEAKVYIHPMKPPTLQVKAG